MTKTRGWHQELLWMSLVLGTLGIATFWSEYAQKALIIVLIFYALWHFSQIYRLANWLFSSKTRFPPDSRGLWGDIFYILFRQRKKHSRRQQDLLNIISQFKASTAALPDGALVLGEKGELLWFNKSAKRMLGFKSNKDKGQRVVNLLRMPEFVKFMDGANYKKNCLITSPIDDKSIFSIRITPYKENQRLMIVRDVTRIHQLEQIRQDFIANASHELRSPLTVISGYLESLTPTITDKFPRYEKPFNDMLGQAHRMKSIVDDLLFLSKLEDPNDQKFEDEIDVAALIENILTESKLIFQKKGQDIKTEVSCSKLLHGSIKELYSAFSNLILNASRYTPEGGKIVVKWQDEDKNRACFSVEDNGIGIEAEHIPRLTERFYRVDSGRAREIGGTGLGLAIVKHVLERHHAKLEILSEIGKGSEFRCIFNKHALID